jgi:hypothetical protein
MPLMTVPAGIPVEPQTLLGTLGMTGCTAYFGMLEIGDPQEGETVVISAAAGAVGSVAGQLAKQRGARVVGIAGGPEKCSWLKDELGFDEAVEYKAEDWRAQLKAATPNGIDVDFENVGGEIMEAVFSRLNMNARVALCGLISGYNDTEPAPGPRTFGNLLVQRVTLKGFIILDYYARFPEALEALGAMVAAGTLRSAAVGAAAGPSALVDPAKSPLSAPRASRTSSGLLRSIPPPDAHFSADAAIFAWNFSQSALSLSPAFSSFSSLLSASARNFAMALACLSVSAAFAAETAPW